MKARIEKIINEYNDKLAIRRRKIDDLRLELKTTKNRDWRTDIRRDIAIEQEKEMILVQARTDFESLLNYL